MKSSTIVSSHLVAKCSQLQEEEHVLIAFCAAPKRAATLKKVAKYAEKTGGRVGAVLREQAE